MKPIKLPYPNPIKILPCGDKVKGRICATSRRTMKLYKPILIRFVTKNHGIHGNFLPDFGGVFGSTGKPFGWTKDITTRTKQHKGSSSLAPILEEMIHFPPSENSRYCRKEKKDILCDKVE